MEKMKNLSLKMTIILYMAIALAVSAVIGFALTNCAVNVQEDVWFKYINKEEYIQSVKNENGNNYLKIGRAHV